MIYTGINSCNEIIKYTPDIETTDDSDQSTKERIIAEAHFLRALYYYDLVRCYSSDDSWANFPYRVEPFEELMDIYVTVHSADYIYENIIYPDLEYAMGVTEDGDYRLPYYRNVSSETGRATLGAAQALAASAYLTRKDYEKAILYSEMVTEDSSSHGYSLISDYADLWDINQETNAYNEVIFGVPFIADASYSSIGSSYAYFFCPSGLNIDGTAFSGNTYGKGLGAVLFQNWFISPYQEDWSNLGYCAQSVYDEDEQEWRDTDGSDYDLRYRDTRIEDSFFRQYCTGTLDTGVTGTSSYYPYASSTSPVALRKYIDPKGVANNTNGNDYFMYRLSEMYLIQAEAYNELNDQTSAMTAFNKLRERSRLSSGRDYPLDIDNVGRTFTKDEFRWAVFMERGLEFAGELKRWYDLIRMEYSGQTMYNYMMNTYIPSLTQSQVNSDDCVMAARKMYFPIPDTEVSRNALVNQNPQY